MASFKIEAQLMDQDYRKKVCDDIFSGQNMARKEEARRRFDVYKDNVVNYVREALEDEMGAETCKEMLNRATNVNIVKQIIEKLARVYQQEVKRTAGEEKAPGTRIEKILNAFSTWAGKITGKINIEEQTAQIQALEKGFALNNTMKKVNRWAELFKNIFIRVVSVPDENENGKYTLRTDILHPGQYDVIEDPDDKTQPACIIFSDSIGKQVIKSDYSGATGARGVNGEELTEEQKDSIRKMNEASSQKSKVAQVGPTEKERKEIKMIWWSKNYHFTTDGLGELVRNELNPKNKNPIGMLPGVSVNIDQDARYWARGGQDIVDQCILMNLQLTDLNYILYLQGNGIFTIIGPDAPTGVIRVGPNHALVIKTKAGGGGDTSASYVSQNPNVEGHLNAISQELALCISTNGLEPSTVATKLDAANVTSGIHLAIEKSTAIGNIKDDEEFYRKVEWEYLRIVAKWLNFLIEAGEANGALGLIGKMNEELRPNIEYTPPVPYYSESEKLDIVKKKQDLGLFHKWELLKMLTPSLSDDAAKKKIEELETENKAKQKEMIGKKEDDEEKERPFSQKKDKPEA